jgi:hypothetical protein
MFILVVIYLIGIPMMAKFRKHSISFDIWIFSFIISLFQILPDWFLAAQLQVLVFPDDGFLRIGEVSAYMAGLWTIPLFLILYITIRADTYLSTYTTYAVSGILAIIIFVGSEQFLGFVWYAQNVFMIGNIALYIIIPEIMLGISAYWIYQQVKQQPIQRKILGGFSTMVLYLGNANLFYFIIEHILNI